MKVSSKDVKNNIYKKEDVVDVVEEVKKTW